MKIITHEDIENLNISPIQCFRWTDQLLRRKKTTILPPKTHMEMEKGIYCNVMPSILLEEHSVGGVKVVTRYPDRIPLMDSKILLFDMERGYVKAILDGNWITAMRTGAVAAHSILQFAKRNFAKVSFIGLGNTAGATLLMLDAVLPSERQLDIQLLQYKNQAEQFAKRFEEISRFRIKIIADIYDLVTQSDVLVSCASYVEEDFCEPECFPKGILVVPVHTRGFINCDPFFDKIYADDMEHVRGFRYFSKFRYFAEVSDVLDGVAKGRENQAERILVYNIGIGSHDINFAAHIYEMMQGVETGTTTKDVEFREPTDKFWI